MDRRDLVDERDRGRVDRDRVAGFRPVTGSGRGTPPMALRTFAASVMCSISSRATLWITSATAVFFPSSIE
jgi:hypothetical protein